MGDRRQGGHVLAQARRDPELRGDDAGEGSSALVLAQAVADQEGQDRRRKPGQERVHWPNKELSDRRQVGHVLVQARRDPELRGDDADQAGQLHEHLGDMTGQDRGLRGDLYERVGLDMQAQEHLAKDQGDALAGDQPDLGGQEQGQRGEAESVPGDRGDAVCTGDHVPSGGLLVDKTVLNILTVDHGGKPRGAYVGVHVGVEDKIDFYNLRKSLKKLPVKRKEPDEGTESCVEPDRKKRDTPLRRKRDTRSEMKDKFKNVNLITNHFQLLSSAVTPGNDRLHAQQGGGGLDGGGERAVPRAHAKKSSSLARGGIGGKTEQLVSRTVVGQPLAADVEQPNTGQLCRQPLGKVYSGETSLK